MNYNVMNYTYEAMELMMRGVDIMDSMLNTLIDGIMLLPDCNETVRLKMMASRTGSDKAKLYEMLSDSYNNAVDMLADEYCAELDSENEPDDEDEPDDKDEFDDEEDYIEADIPTGAELQGFLNLIDNIFSSGNPVSISADIYINENKAGKDKSDNDEERNND
ncbi:MAG: hypothetical protein LIO59_00100 [Oscillospiraceae bacterium]|nr:hypothetical protein [Oscillospiraceae bacterium]